MKGLRVFVAVKRVVDYAVKVRIKADKSGAWLSCATRAHEAPLAGTSRRNNRPLRLPPFPCARDPHRSRRHRERQNVDEPLLRDRG